MEKKMITTQEELDELRQGSHIWGSSNEFPDEVGSGSPYEKLDDGMWWDYGNDFAVGSDDIRLPALLVWEP